MRFRVRLCRRGVSQPKIPSESSPSRSAHWSGRIIPPISRRPEGFVGVDAILLNGQLALRGPRSLCMSRGLPNYDCLIEDNQTIFAETPTGSDGDGRFPSHPSFVIGSDSGHRSRRSGRRPEYASTGKRSIGSGQAWGSAKLRRSNQIRTRTLAASPRTTTAVSGGSGADFPSVIPIDGHYAEARRHLVAVVRSMIPKDLPQEPVEVLVEGHLHGVDEGPVGNRGASRLRQASASAPCRRGSHTLFPRRERMWGRRTPRWHPGRGLGLCPP